MATKRIAILGATGSIGAAAADVARSHPDEFRVVAATALRSAEKCEALAREFGAKAYVGEDSALQAAQEADADVFIVATVGASGIRPALAALERGCDVALATKEVLVMAGELATATAAKSGARILPVDSEHSAIFQCLPVRDGMADVSEVEKLTLTASGGPFLDGPEDLSQVTAQAALKHPRWSMGHKVTVDSATMMNKGFEVLEARWLFGIPEERIGVVVHPESIVHSLVEFRDGATLAQLSPPDMRVAVQYALTWPRRIPSERKRLNLAAAGSLTFREPDEKRFPALSIVRGACKAGGSAPAIVAAADEWAVERFLAGEIGFTDIASAAKHCLDRVAPLPCSTVEEIEEAVRATRAELDSWFKGHGSSPSWKTQWKT